MKKNDRYDLEILDNGMNFEGIAKYDHQVVFIPETLKGEIIDTKIIKVNKSYAIGKVESIKKISMKRCEPFCEVYFKCGGCSCQHIEYNEQLKLKREIVENALAKQNVSVQKINHTIGMGIPMYYRNKVQYPVRRNLKEETKIGFYLKRSHAIVENISCYIQHYEIDRIAKLVFEKLVREGFVGYSDDKKDGDIRHIIIRRGANTHEVMIVIVVNHQEAFQSDRFNMIVKELSSEIENIKSIYLNLNNSVTNEILGRNEKLIFGEKYIYDYIGKYKYAISPKSFFQVNTIQAEVLYQTLKDGLKLNQREILFDLYSGVGSIGIFLSNDVAKVYGIEIEKQAVEMANINISENNITNAEYIAGSVEEKIVEFKERNISPDVIVVDPPRKGLDEESIQYILEFAPEKIGYVSCNPATLARDLKLLSEKYSVLSVTPVDMFPQTSAIESVAILKRK
ncbi:MAG: 23S rRNA (uracil(1939)-C(5))-methyltransferase RlmD [Clostridia bacterium]|nr:23S rRNA (uracil(1939)-C(5))-methyltransferase RlmD [Clostridia bacterium]